MIVNQNIPKLRFPEFEGEWKFEKLKDISKIERGRFSPRPRNNPIYYNGKIPFVQTSDVVNANGKIEFYSQTLNEKGLVVSKLFPKGSILITIAANIGHSGVLQIDMACPDSLIGIKPNSNIHNYYLNYYLSTHQKKMDYLAPEGAQKNINIEFLNPYKIPFPSLPEQTKIASFLTAVDDKLHALKQKHALLEQYKKGIMQKIFTQELRFKPSPIEALEIGGDYPDWEEKKLGEVGMFYSGGTPLTTKRQYFGGTIPFIRSGEINSIKTEQFITEEGLKNSSAKMVEVGDILYALYGATSGEVGISKINGAINQAVLCIKSKENHYYLYSYLKFEKENIINTFLQGGQGNLSSDIVKKITIPLPSQKEQTKIASFLSTLDEKINQCQAQIAKTEVWKKGLLQQLFV